MSELVQIAVPRHLGDAVLSLSALRRLAVGLPGRKLRLVSASDLVLDLLANQGPWERGSASFVKSREGAAVLLAPSLRVALKAWWARIPERIGLATDGRGPLLSERVAEPDGPLPSAGLPALLPPQHQSLSYLRVARRALAVLGGCESHDDGRFVADRRARTEGALWWREAGEPTVLLHPWAEGLSTKRWHPERWLQLAQLLQGQGERVVFSGGPRGDDAALASALARELRVPVCAGQHALSPSAWVVVAELCGKVVVCDTGLSHLSAAAGLDPVVLFGPTDPRRHGPLRGAVVSGGEGLPCSPCYKETCVNSAKHLCMDSVRVADVLAALAGHVVRRQPEIAELRP